MSKDNKRIATLWDNKSNEDQHEHEHPHQDGQAFYAGGSEHSGQQILGPSREDSDPNRLIDNIFENARRSAELVSDQNNPSSSATVLPIVMWRNGFTVGQDGELREYATNESRQFLEYLRRGETPPELASRVRGGLVDVKLENKGNQDYKPKRKIQAFSGEGHRLGAPSPEMVEEQQSSTTAAPPGSSVSSSLSLDSSQPATTIQIRLVDNSRLVVRVNLTHRVGDLVSHIRAIRPQYSETNFVLATTFPAKELTDLEQTVSEAKLANASVLQKIKRQT